MTESDRAQADEFVRSALSVRRNVVKLWRPLPPNLWSALDHPDARRRSVRAERTAIAGVGLMVLLLAGVLAHVGHRAVGDSGATVYPLIGRPMPDWVAGVPGWIWRTGLSLRLVGWTVIPTLVGWVFVRAVWIPLVTRGTAHRDSAAAVARHLGGVYLFVFLMITTGAVLMPVMILMAPDATRTVRWWLWCFLFGESFFVPAVMWIRLALCDARGRVFGRFRHLVLIAYVVVFVVLPILGMVGELSRLP